MHAKSLPAAYSAQKAAPVAPSSVTKRLPLFNPRKHWDADSTPGPLRDFSRNVGKLWGNTGARTPKVEAAIVMASLMHDVAYYYGGSGTQRAQADETFGKQIEAFGALFGPDIGKATRATALVDKVAVRAGGGFPFKEDYSWGFGNPESQRGYTKLGAAEGQKIHGIAERTFRSTVQKIADGTFEYSKVQKQKFGKPDDPAYGKALEKEMRVLAKKIMEQVDQSPGTIPGLAAAS
jgi:hypothetical protein